MKLWAFFLLLGAALAIWFRAAVVGSVPTEPLVSSAVLLAWAVVAGFGMPFFTRRNYNGTSAGIGMFVLYAMVSVIACVVVAGSVAAGGNPYVVTGAAAAVLTFLAYLI